MSYEVSLHVLRERLDDKNDIRSGRRIYPHSSLEMGQNYGILGQIIDLSFIREADRLDIPKSPHIPTRPIPLGIEFYIGGKFTHKDAYGDKLIWSHAQDLAAIDVPDEMDSTNGFTTHNINRAVKAYLHELAGDTSVVIYTH